MQIPLMWLVGSLVATGATTGLLLADAAAREALHFDRLARETRDRVANRVFLYQYGLRGIRGLFAASDAVTREEFHAYWSSRDPLNEFPGALGVGYIARTPGTADAGRESWVITYAEPEDYNRSAVGYDIAAEPTRHRAALAAARSGTPVLSDPLRLLSAPAAGPGFNFYLPVYRAGAPLRDEAERLAATTGWVAMPILLQRVMKDVEPPDHELAIRIYDGDSAHSGSLLYETATFAPDGPRLDEALSVGGRPWTLEFTTGPAFAATSRLPVLLVAAGGCLLSFVFYRLLRELSHAKRRAEARAEAMTVELQNKARELERLALIDPLTGLPNRRLFLDRLEQAILAQRRDPARRCALLLIDLDGFKQVNDEHGHAIGDELLKAIAARLRGQVRAADSVTRVVDGNTTARLGGDEFVVLLQNLAQPGDASAVAERVLEAVRAPLVVGGHTIVPGASIGVVDDALAFESTDALVDAADQAMYRAKASGRGRYVTLELARS